MEVTLGLAKAADAKRLLAYLQKVAQQTNFLVMEDLAMDSTAYGELLDFAADSPRHLMLYAEVSGEIIGLVNVNGSPEEARRHCGEIGITVDQKFWRLGIAQLLMEELDYWWQEASSLTRLELYVQERNHAARALYRKFHFQEEGCLQEGVLTPDGGAQNLILMAKLQEK